MRWSKLCNPVADRFVMACLAGASFVAAAVLGGCATRPAGASSTAYAESGLSVAAESRLTGTPRQVAACLRKRDNVASYPQGVAPGMTTAEVEGDVVHLTQWFFLKRGFTWTTLFVLRPAGDAATDVQVLLPVELSASQGYRRAAVELIANCQAKPATAPNQTSRGSAEEPRGG